MNEHTEGPSTARPARRHKPNARREVIAVRLTEDEARAIQLAAERDGVSVSRWLRTKIGAMLAAEPK